MKQVEIAKKGKSERNIFFSFQVAISRYGLSRFTSVDPMELPVEMDSVFPVIIARLSHLYRPIEDPEAFAAAAAAVAAAGRRSGERL